MAVRYTNIAKSVRRHALSRASAILLVVAAGACAVGGAGCSSGGRGCRAESGSGATGGRGGGSDALGRAAGASGGTGLGDSALTDLESLPDGHEILLIGGFMSELYEAFSINIERELNESLRQSARALNVHVDLPGEKSIDFRVGDAIADSLPWFPLPIQPGGFITFHTQEAHFTALGIPFRNLARVSHAYDSTETVPHNAAAIRVFLRRHASTRFVLVTHSKGGLDTLHALLDAEELWGSTVVGWVALQAPFYGSPIADSPPVTASRVLLDALGGNSASVDDLKTSTRARYMEDKAERIRSLTSKIPVITAYSTYEAGNTVAAFAGTLADRILDAGLIARISQIVRENYAETPRDISGVVSRSAAAAVTLIRARVTTALSESVAAIGLMDLTNIYMNAVRDEPNDGLVPAASTGLPGVTRRRLPLGDHASPVMDVDPLKNFWTAERRNGVTSSLIAEVLASERE